MTVIAPSERYEGTLAFLQNNAPFESYLIYVSCAKCLLPLYAPSARYCIYSPERVAKVAKRYGLIAGSSMVVTTGFVFTKDTDKQLAWERVKQEAPFVFIGSPPCT